MLKRSITQSKLDELLGRIPAEGLRLIAPVRSGDRLVFQPVASAAEIERDYTNTDMPPKEYLFPQSEPVLRYRFEGKAVQVEGIEPEVVETVLFGVRPCDAAGIGILEKVFSWDYRDEFFMKRREKTIVVSVSCTDPAAWCFCGAVGYGPASTSGSDVLLTKVSADAYLVEATTDRGQAFVKRFEKSFRSDEPLEKAPSVKAAEAKLARRDSLSGIGDALRRSFSDERWAALGRACVGCTACAHCCPSCHCFDIVDEGDVRGGVRLKNWDACSQACFTLHASGHNPRGTQGTRYRQRVLHKFSYFPERFGQVMCVGCGRCLLNCPAQQDIYAAALGLAASGPERKASGG